MRFYDAHNITSHSYPRYVPDKLKRIANLAFPLIDIDLSAFIYLADGLLNRAMSNFNRGQTLEKSSSNHFS